LGLSASVNNSQRIDSWSDECLSEPVPVEHKAHRQQAHYLGAELKGGAALESFETLPEYCGLRGWELALAQAKAGDAAAIAGYCGKSDALDKAIGRFAASYGKHNEHSRAKTNRADKAKNLGRYFNRFFYLGCNGKTVQRSPVVFSTGNTALKDGVIRSTHSAAHARSLRFNSHRFTQLIAHFFELRQKHFVFE